MADADGLQWHGRQALPVRRGVHLVLQPLGVVQVPAQAGLQTFHAHVHEVEPKLERAEAAAQLDVPVPEVAHLAVLGRAQVAGIGAHDADQVLGIPHVVGAEVEAHAHPLVGVENQAVGPLHALPHPAALGQDHGRARQGRVHVEPHPVLLRDVRHGRHGIERRGARGAHGRPRARRAGGRSQILLDGRRQEIQAEGVVLVRGDQPQEAAAEARQQGGLLDGAVALVRGVDHQRRLAALQALGVLGEAGSPSPGRRAGP